MLNAAAPLGILAVAVALLMIAGEFDLSVGSIIGAAGMSIMLLTQNAGWELWPAIAGALMLSLVIGFANGVLVVRTGLPSFIVTLGTLFVFRGLTIAVSRALTRRTQLGGLDQVPGYESARVVFASDPAGPFRVSILWWLGLAALATWLLLRTRWGNWIYAAGGSPESARKLGVPVARLKVAPVHDDRRGRVACRGDAGGALHRCRRLAGRAAGVPSHHRRGDRRAPC